MKSIYVVTLKGIPTRCFDTHNEAQAWVDKMHADGIKYNWFNIYQTLYYV